MYAAAAARGVTLQDGMWTRYYPAAEHARLLIEEGAIGEVLRVQSDFFDPIYAIQAAPLGFGGTAHLTPSPSAAADVPPGRRCYSRPLSAPRAAA